MAIVAAERIAIGPHMAHDDETPARTDDPAISAKRHWLSYCGAVLRLVFRVSRVSGVFRRQMKIFEDGQDARPALDGFIAA